MIRRILVAVVLLSASLVQAGPDGDLARLEAQDFALQGLFQGETQLAYLGITHDAVPVQMTLEALIVHAEVDMANSTTLPGVALQPEFSTHDFDWSAVRAYGFAPGQALTFEVFALPGRPATMWLEHGQGEVGPGAADIEATQRVPSPDRMMPRIAVPSAMAWTGTGQVRTIIEGDFVVAVYDWDLDLIHENGQTLLATGREEGALANTPDASALVVAAVSNRQAYLYVTGGRLELASSRVLVAAESMGGTLLGNLTMNVVSGELGDGQQYRPLTGQQITLAGSFTLAAEAGRDAVALKVSGSLDAATGESGSLTWAAPVAPSTGAWLTVLAGILSLAMLAVVAVLLRRRTEVWQMNRIEADRASGRHVAVVNRTRRLFSSGVFAEDARILHVEALIRLGQTKRARELLAEATAWPTGAQASRSYLSALAAAAANQREEAKRWLSEAVRIDPRMVDVAKTEPLLASMDSVAEGYS